MGSCLRCGYPIQAHCRADGACISAPCKGFVEKWPDEAPTPIPPSAEESRPAAPSDKFDLSDKE